MNAEMRLALVAAMTNNYEDATKFLNYVAEDLTMQLEVLKNDLRQTRKLIALVQKRQAKKQRAS